jgi:hypothetical protein
LLTKIIFDFFFLWASSSAPPSGLFLFTASGLSVFSAFPPLDSAFSALDFAFSDLGSAFPALDPAFSDLGSAFSALDPAFSDLGSAFSALDPAFSDLGSAFPALDPVFSDFGSVFSTFVSAFPVFVSAFSFSALEPVFPTFISLLRGSFVPLPPNALRTISAAASSIELWATFASIPFSCKNLRISLLCLSNSLASSCTFIFAIPSPPFSLYFFY